MSATGSTPTVSAPVRATTPAPHRPPQPARRHWPPRHIARTACRTAAQWRPTSPAVMVTERVGVGVGVGVGVAVGVGRTTTERRPHRHRRSLEVTPHTRRVLRR